MNEHEESNSKVEQALGQMRSNLDGIDRALLDLLNRRMQCIHHIGALKHRHGLPIAVPERENRLLQSLLAHNQGSSLPPAQLLCCFRLIIALSKQTERIPQVLLHHQDRHLTSLFKQYLGHQITYRFVRHTSQIGSYLQANPHSLAIVPLHAPQKPCVWSSIEQIPWQYCSLIDEFQLRRNKANGSEKLWVYGILAGTMTVEMAANRAYFYCAYNHDRTQTLLSLCRSFGMQLRSWRHAQQNTILFRLSNETNHIRSNTFWQQVEAVVGSLQRLGIYAYRQLAWTLTEDH